MTDKQIWLRAAAVNHAIFVDDYFLTPIFLCHVNNGHYGYEQPKDITSLYLFTPHAGISPSREWWPCDQLARVTAACFLAAMCDDD